MVCEATEEGSSIGSFVWRVGAEVQTKTKKKGVSWWHFEHQNNPAPARSPILVARPLSKFGKSRPLISRVTQLPVRIVRIGAQFFLVRWHWTTDFKTPLHDLTRVGLARLKKSPSALKFNCRGYSVLRGILSGEYEERSREICHRCMLVDDGCG